MNEVSYKGFLKIISGLEKESLENHFDLNDQETSRIQSELLQYFRYEDTSFLSQLLSMITIIEATSQTFSAFLDADIGELKDIPKEILKDFKDYQKLSETTIKHFMEAMKKYIRILDFKRKGIDHA